MKLSDYQQPERKGVSICLHGPSGAGKSQSLTTIPLSDTLVLVDSEDGLRTTAPKLLGAGRTDENTHLRSAHEPEDVMHVLHAIHRAIDAGKLQGRVWVVIDSVSQPLHALIRQATGEHGLKVYGRVGQTHAAIVDAVSALARVGAVVVGVYYSGAVEYADGERMGPQVPGSKSHVVPHTYDVVLHVEGQGADDGSFSQTTYCRQTHSVQARDRTDRLPVQLAGLDWSRIAAILLDGASAEATPATPEPTAPAVDEPQPAATAEELW